MSEATAGYADSARPVDDIIKAYVAARKDERKPTVIWIADDEDAKTNEALESRVFNNEDIGIAMKRFTCLRGAVQMIPDERIAGEAQRRTPSFYFFNPAGELVNEVHGKRATSRSGFSACVGKLFDLSFAMSLKDYSKRMGKILDQMDRVAGEKERLDAKIERAADNPGKLAPLVKEQDELKEKQAALETLEQELLGVSGVKPDFLPGAGNPEGG